MSSVNSWLEAMDDTRRAAGFLTVTEVIALRERDNVILDPFSVLIGRSITVGWRNYFYPGTVIECHSPGEILVGDENRFIGGCYLFADSARLVIGNGNEFGPGGCVVKANRSDAPIQIGHRGRYVNGPLILGGSHLGSGSQIIGPITVERCTLSAGGDHSTAHPDARGSVLKGCGLARDITLAQGDVINAHGDFSKSLPHRQSRNHPRPEAQETSR